jgi:hypothetical protein
VVDPLEHMMEEDRVIFPGVRPPEEDHIGLFRFPIRAGAPTGTEDRRQTDDARCVSRSVTAVDVVGAEPQPSQLLGEEIDLIAGFGAAEGADRVAAVSCLGPEEPFGGAIERFLPAGGAQLAVFADQGLG